VAWIHIWDLGDTALTGVNTEDQTIFCIQSVSELDLAALVRHNLEQPLDGGTVPALQPREVLLDSRGRHYLGPAEHLASELRLAVEPAGGRRRGVRSFGGGRLRGPRADGHEASA